MWGCFYLDSWIFACAKYMFPTILLIWNEDPFCIFFTGLNKEFRKMLSEHAEFKALNLKDILTASDGTKKVNTILLLLPRSHYNLQTVS